MHDLFDTLLHKAPALASSVDVLRPPAAPSLDREWQHLQRMLTAHAPSGGCLLPGSISDVVAQLAQELGLGGSYLREIGHSGNPGLSIGARTDAVDIVITAHIDRPSFRVRQLTPGQGGVLYPICADRFPAPAYSAQAVAFRWEPGQGLIAGASGEFRADANTPGQYAFVNQQGQLELHDVVTLAAQPQLSDGVITGTGLDNCLGALSALYAARILRQAEAALSAAGRRIVIAFTDQEEGIPTAFFGHGAARLIHALPQPRIGAIVSDAHAVNPGIVEMGGGASHGTASAWGRGSYAPPNFHRLAVDLAGSLNLACPQTVQINHGYQSRSDDLGLSRWTRILGMSGPPMIRAHTAEESAHLGDVPRSALWLASFALACAGIDDSLRRHYALPA